MKNNIKSQKINLLCVHCKSERLATEICVRNKEFFWQNCNKFVQAITSQILWNDKTEINK